MTGFEVAFLAMTIAAFVLFAMTLFVVARWSESGEKAATRPAPMPGNGPRRAGH